MKKPKFKINQIVRVINDKRIDYDKTGSVSKIETETGEWEYSLKFNDSNQPILKRTFKEDELEAKL